MEILQLQLIQQCCQWATELVITSRHTQHCRVTDLLAKAWGANTDGPNNALPIATEPLRYFMSAPGADEYIRFPTPSIHTHTDRHIPLASLGQSLLGVTLLLLKCTN